ncbi:MAG: putative sigma-54 modulation protein [Actinomycetota bacterium]|jgi:ribosomal subunit interface protein|nr:putative sigma-54 modulation protein [Actinomycetota bacterium]
MDVVVVGKHTEVDSALRALTVERVERVSKFASDVRRVDVDYEQHPTRRAEDSHACEILVHVRQHLVKGSAAGTEHVIALERALDKVEEQMRRLHGRRVGRRNGSRARSASAAAAASPITTADDDDDAGAAADGDGGGRMVVKSKHFDVKPMGVEEAALQMELLGHDFFLFTLADSGRCAVVYRRRDGHLGLIEASS